MFGHLSSRAAATRAPVVQRLAAVAGSLRREPKLEPNRTAHSTRSVACFEQRRSLRARSTACGNYTTPRKRSDQLIRAAQLLASQLRRESANSPPTSAQRDFPSRCTILQREMRSKLRDVRHAASGGGSLIVAVEPLPVAERDALATSLHFFFQPPAAQRRSSCV